MKTWFANLKLAKKLALGYGISLLLACVIAAAAFRGFLATQNSLEAVSGDVVSGLIALNRFDGAARQVRIYQYRLAGNEEKSVVDELTAKVDESRKEATSALDEYAKAAVSPQDKANVDTLRAYWNAYDVKWKHVEAKLAVVDTEAGFALMESDMAPPLRAQGAAAARQGTPMERGGRKALEDGGGRDSGLSAAHRGGSPSPDDRRQRGFRYHHHPVHCR